MKLPLNIEDIRPFTEITDNKKSITSFLQEQGFRAIEQRLDTRFAAVEQHLVERFNTTVNQQEQPLDEIFAAVEQHLGSCFDSSVGEVEQHLNVCFAAVFDEHEKRLHGQLSMHENDLKNVQEQLSTQGKDLHDVQEMLEEDMLIIKAEATKRDDEQRDRYEAEKMRGNEEQQQRQQQHAELRMLFEEEKSRNDKEIFQQR